MRASLIFGVYFTLVLWGPDLGHASVSIPKIDFELDRDFACLVSGADPEILIHLRDTFGVEVVKTPAELRQPGSSIKFLPSPKNPYDGLMQLPIAVWREAEAVLPHFRAEWDRSRVGAKGAELLRGIVLATGVPFPFAQKTFKLYLCPNLAAAYKMESYPFYTYLKSIYGLNNQAKRWSLRDFVDVYMFHEILHWYLLFQPWLRVWTPKLRQQYDYFKANDPQFSLGPLIFPAFEADPRLCRDAYPNLHFNMVNLLGHLHGNAIQRAVFAKEPLRWNYVLERTKAITQDKYYALALDIIDRASPQELSQYLTEVASTSLKRVGKCHPPLSKD